MTDNEIVKALEVCSNGYCYRDGCPLASGLEDDSIDKCTSELSKAAIDLVNRQKAEIEMWKDIAKRETGYVKIARAEAIKEFAERLKSEFEGLSVCTVNSVANKIDNLVKEMTEETP